MQLNELIAVRSLTQAQAVALFSHMCRSCAIDKLTRFSSERLLRFLRQLDAEPERVPLHRESVKLQY